MKKGIKVVANFVSACEKTPEVEGYYLVVRFSATWKIAYAADIQWTKNGWNTSYSCVDGSPVTEHRMNLEGEGSDYYWADFCTMEEHEDE